MTTPNRALEALQAYLDNDSAQAEFWLGHDLVASTADRRLNVRASGGTFGHPAVSIILGSEERQLPFFADVSRPRSGDSVVVEEPAFVFGVIAALLERQSHKLGGSHE